MANNKNFYDPETGTYKNQITTLIVHSKAEDIRLSRGAAYQDLTPAAYALYILASLDADYFARTWSWQSVNAWCGMPYSTYRKAIGELVKKKYIEDGYFYLAKGIENLSLKNESTPLENESTKKKTLKNESKSSLKNESSTSQKREYFDF